MKRIAITGSSGLIGTALRRSLAAQGHSVLRLVRAERRESEQANPASYIPWYSFDEAHPVKDSEALEGLDAVVHLAGENLADGRWTAEKKRRIVESRTIPTRALARLLAGLKTKPRVLVSASAIGIYGDRGEESLTELDDPGSGFLPDTVKAWEAAADAARAAGIRVVHPRFGVVLSPAGGALKKMLPVFRAGLGGRLGDGQQWISWVSLRDTVAAIEFLIQHEGLAGAVNVVSPQPVRNADFTRALARALHRPAIFAVPRFALRAAFGEMAEATILASTRVLPEILLAEDLRFQDVDVSSALAAMFR
jgi:uncharacterized protein (TIGR01777 family)